MVIKYEGDWKILRDMSNMYFVAFDFPEEKRHLKRMTLIRQKVMQALKDAQNRGIDFVMFFHGHSTSGPFIMTPRSIVRSIMDSKEAAPFIMRDKSIQHRSVFVAAIKPKVDF